MNRYDDAELFQISQKMSLSILLACAPSSNKAQHTTDVCQTFPLCCLDNMRIDYIVGKQ